MDTQAIVFEYGKLQLNYVAVTNQNAQLSQSLADANRESAQLLADLKAANEKIAALTQGQDVSAPGIRIVPDQITEAEPSAN